MNADDTVNSPPPDWRGLAHTMLKEQEQAASAMVFGDYMLEEEIARGGMGIVYRARQLSLDRAVAVKVLREGVFAAGQEVERFRQEASAAAALRHPGIVPVFESGDRDGRCFYVMEWIAGPNLAELTRERPATARQAAQWVREVAEAIAHAHGQGVIHRDLKPANVLLDPEGRTRVTDFGMAQRADAAGGLTLSGQMLGTPGYMAPEVAGGKARTAGAAADIYGLGALLFHLLTGRAPFIGESHATVLRQLAEAEPVSPRLLNASVPRDLETICLKALSREPARRFSSAQDMAEDLGRFLNGEPVRARPVSGMVRMWRWCRRRPALATSLAAIAALGVGIVVTTLRSNRRIEGLRQEAEERLYASDMRLALQNIGEGKFGAAVKLLERHEPGANNADRRGFEWYAAQALCRSDELAALEDMDGPVRAAVWSPDGRWIAAGAGQWRVWEMTGGRAVLRHASPEKTVALAFHADSRRLAVALADGRLSVCDPAVPGAPLFSSQIPAGSPAMAWRGNLLEIINGAVHLRWKPGGGEPVTVASLPGEARGPVLNATGTMAAFLMPGRNSDEPWRFAAWNTAEAVPAVQWTVADGRTMRSWACSDDGKWLATGDYSGRAALRRAPFPQTAREDTIHRGMIEQIAFTKDSSRMATAGDGTIQVRATDSGYFAGVLRGHRRLVTALTFSPDGDQLLSGDYGGALKLWKSPRSSGSDDARPGNGLLFSADGGTLVWLAAPERISIQTGNGPVRTIHAAPQGDIPVAMPDGVALTPLKAGTMRVFRAAGAAGVEQIAVPGAAWSFSRDVRWLAHADATGRATITDLGGSRPLLTLSEETNPSIPQFSADSRLAIHGSGDGTVRVFDLAAGRLLCAIPAHRAWAYGTALSRDGTLAASAGFDGAARLWDAASGELRREFISNVETLWSVALSPDGSRLAAGTGESTVILWDTATGLETGVLDTGLPRYPVESLIFTPDGEGLVARQRYFAAPRR